MFIGTARSFVLLFFSAYPQGKISAEPNHNGRQEKGNQS